MTTHTEAQDDTTTWVLLACHRTYPTPPEKGQPVEPGRTLWASRIDTDRFVLSDGFPGGFHTITTEKRLRQHFLVKPLCDTDGERWVPDDTTRADLNRLRTRAIEYYGAWLLERIAAGEATS